MKKLTKLLAITVLACLLFGGVGPSWSIIPSASSQTVYGATKYDFFDGLYQDNASERTPIVLWASHDQKVVRYIDNDALSGGVLLSGITASSVEESTGISFSRLNKEVIGFYLGDGKMYYPGEDISISSSDINSVTGSLNIYTVSNMTQDSDGRALNSSNIIPDNEYTQPPKGMATTRIFDIDGISWNVDNTQIDSGNYGLPQYKDVAGKIIFLNYEIGGYGSNIYMPEAHQRQNYWDPAYQHGAGCGEDIAEQVKGIFSEDSVATSYLGDDKNGSLFYLDEDTNNQTAGYYVYDSETRGAYYSTSDERFYLTENPTRLYSYGSPLSGFFPLNEVDEELSANARESGAPNYHFGTHTSIDFYMPSAAGNADCQAINPVTGELSDLEFQFKGDDDVAIYLDGELLLDLTGIHSKTTASINFSKGEAQFFSINKSTEDANRWLFDTNRFDLSRGEHRLDVYYLERGGNQSNLYMSFMLPEMPSIEKRIFKGHGTHEFNEDLNVDTHISEVESGDPVHYSIEVKDDNIANKEIHISDSIEDVSYDLSDVKVRTSSGKDITSYFNIYEDDGVLYIKTDARHASGVSASELGDIVVEIDGIAYPDEKRPTKTIYNQAYYYDGVSTVESNKTSITPMSKGELIVKHQLEDGTDLKDSVTTTEKVGAPYTTSEESFEGYRIKTVPSNKTGEYTDGTIEVIYVYEPIPADVIVHYVDEDGNKLSDDIHINGKETDPYTTEQKTFPDYNFKEVTGDPTSGTMKGTKEVTYVYVKKEGTLTVKHVTTDGTDLKAPVTTTEKVGTDYTTKEESFKGYRLVETPNNAEGKYVETPTTVTYVYAPIPAKVNVIHVDEDGNPVAPGSSEDGNVGDPYETKPADPEGYTLKITPGNAKGEMTEEPIDVIYVYTKKPGALEINYVDEDGKSLTPQDTTDGKMGDPYKTQPKEIAGYELVKVDGEEEGTLPDGTQVVTYVYKKIPSELTVNYVDEDGKVLAPKDESKGFVNDPYETKPKDIDGYELVKVEGEEKGTLTKDPTVVTYIYKPIKGAMEIEKNVDKETAKEGDVLSYTVTAKQTVKGGRLNAILTDPVPEGLELDASSIKTDGDEAEVNVKDNAIEVSVPEFKDKVVLTFKATVKASSGTITNIATLDAEGLDPVKDDAKTKLIEPKKPEVTLEKTVNKEKANYGDKLTYTITAKQTVKGAVVNNAVIKDPVPSGLDIDMKSIKVKGDDSEIIAKEGESFEVRIPEFKDEVKITFIGTITADTLNVATLTGEDIEEVKDDAKTEIIPPNPSIEKTVSKESVQVGDIVTYTIKAKSDGILKDAVIVDELPEGVTLLSDTIKAKGEVSIKDNLLVVKCGDLGSEAIRYKAKVTSKGTHKNIATLSGSNTDKKVSDDAVVEAKAAAPKENPTSVSNPPKTGDNAPLIALGALLVAAMAGIGMILYRRKKS